jgi:predicted signal transduction protein with EAL and GGDEF domain
VPDAGDLVRLNRLAEDVITGLSAPYEIDDNRLFIGASMGSAVSPRDGRSGETLVRNADLALYRAKDDGRGVHRRYEQRLSLHAEERRGIEIALRDALERGEFTLAYQPIVGADDARVIGFEGLLRWTSAELGEVSPERFVPIAEEARLMSRIGEWAIRTACAEAATWPAPTRIALNLSAEQLHDPQLIATLVSALSSSGLEPERLELEVDEAVFLRPGGDISGTIDRLATIGVRVTLTGFGTGYASLGYLRTARFSSIKLDRSFIAGAARDMADSVAIIRAVVAIADGLGMTVTAEGTETERHYELLRRLGCGQAQGWLFGRPVPAHDARMLAGCTAAREAA